MLHYSRTFQNVLRSINFKALPLSCLCPINHQFNHLHRKSNHHHHHHVLSPLNKLPLSTGLRNMFTNPIQKRDGCINPKMITHPSIHGLKTKLLCSLNKYALLVSERRDCFIVNCCSGLCLTETLSMTA